MRDKWRKLKEFLIKVWIKILRATLETQGMEQDQLEEAHLTVKEHQLHMDQTDSEEGNLDRILQSLDKQMSSRCNKLPFNRMEVDLVSTQQITPQKNQL